MAGTAIVGQTVSSPYYNPGTTINSSSGQVIGSPAAGPALPAPGTNPQSTPAAPSNNNQPSAPSTGLDPHINPNTNQWDDNWYANWANGQKGNAQAELDARNNQIKSDIHGAYQPIYDELDRQIGGIPGAQQNAEGQVNTLATGQQKDINIQKDSDTSDLQNDINNENNTANQNLNGLSKNIRNMLQGAAFYLGSLGSGDSSAAQDYTTAITNNADMTRGQVLNTRDMANNQIQQKMADVSAAASKNLNDVETWKNTQLNQVAQDFRNQLNQLSMSKATAQGQEGKDVASLRQSALDNFYSRLKQLDDTVANYKATINQWQTERAGWLNDQLTLMHSGAGYNSNSNAAQQAQINALSQGQNNGINNGNTAPASSTGVPGSGNGQASPVSQSNPFNLKDLVGSAGNILNGVNNNIISPLSNLQTLGGLF